MAILPLRITSIRAPPIQAAQPQSSAQRGQAQQQYGGHAADLPLQHSVPQLMAPPCHPHPAHVLGVGGGQLSSVQAVEPHQATAVHPGQCTAAESAEAVSIAAASARANASCQAAVQASCAGFASVGALINCCSSVLRYDPDRAPKNVGWLVLRVVCAVLGGPVLGGARVL